MIRIFVAFPIPRRWSELFLDVSKNNLTVNKTRWTPEPNMHITLFFIGEILENNLEDVQSALEGVLKGQKEFKLEFETLELKGKKNSPSMLWARFKNDNSFTKLSHEIYQAVKPFMTIESIYSDPIPHCTLARIKPGADLINLNLKIVLFDQYLLINKAELWQTIQSKDGVRYNSIKQFDLI
jgi:RNA 2',3'-cyclic 3'-phosphodiesterase